MRGVRELEFVVGAGFLLGPMIFALSLPRTLVIEDCATPVAASVEAPACSEPSVTEPSVTEPSVTEPSVTEPELGSSTRPHFTARPFMFVAEGKLILDADAPAEWGRGELFEPSGAVSFRAARRVELDRLPSEFAARLGQPIDLYGPSGKLCTAKVEGFGLVAQYEGWSFEGLFDSTTEFEHDDEGQAIGVSPAEIRKQLWATQPKWLVAEFGDCTSASEALWARDTALPAPMILTKSTQANATTRARTRALRRSGVLSQIETDYATYYAGLDDESREWAPDWATISAEHPLRAEAWLDAQGQTHVVELNFGTMEDGCGDFFDPRIRRLEVRGEQGFEALELANDPIAVFDADLDGQLEFLYDTSDQGWSRRLESHSGALAGSVEIDFEWTCPC